MPRKILIVDDNQINRLLLKNILCRDYDVLEAENGEDALFLMHRHYKMLSAVLLDIVMPGISGYDVLRAAHENPLLTQIPIIMVTGAQDEESHVKALSMGANDFIVKPFNTDIVKHCVKNNIALRETASTLNAIQKDKLTGLYNRETFFDKVTVKLKDSKPSSYILSCFDIDNFKLINDRYGAGEGDRILREIGKFLQSVAQKIGAIAGRISSDNFAMLMPIAGSDMNINELVAKENFSLFDTQPIVFSIGRYVISDTKLPASAIYDRAFIAKRSVKGRYDKHIAYFSEEMLEKLVVDQQIIIDTDTAVRERQFEVWFQPQYNHCTGAMIGAEALVRWRHPEKGLIPPYIFIPVYEQNGFIYELDKYVWEEVCRYIRKKLDSGIIPLPISVNVSRYDIFRIDFFEFITGLIEKYEIPIELLRLEVTESAFAESTKHVISIVGNLIKFGFTVEIDDFGSGYSSLNTLKDVPAQILKLDMRFFENGDSGSFERGGNIIESVVRMAKWLGMAVIAEGVEEIEQADYLRSIGCSYIQGYLYAKPMPLNEYDSYVSGVVGEEKLLALETVENLDNNAFWDPSSMDTLIFNSYIGGACILEYHNGAIELLRANEKYAQVIGNAGMTIEDALKLNWTDYLDAQNLKRVTDDILKSIATKSEVTGEYVFTGLPNCPEKTYLRSTLRVIATAGDRYLLYCTNENITKTVLAARQLEVIMQNIDGGVTATVVDGDKVRLLFANKKHYEQLGYTKDEYDSQYAGVPNCILPCDRERVVNEMKQATKASGTRTTDFCIMRKDGEKRYMRTSASVMDYPGEEKPVMLVVSNDVTEQVESEKKVKRLTDQLQAIMDNVDIGIIAATVDANGKAEYVFANDYYYSMLGYTKEQFEREVHSPFETIAPEDMHMLHNTVTNITGGSIKTEYHALTRSGERRLVRSAVAISTLSGIDAPVQLSVIRDITEERAAQEKLLETDEKLRFLNKMSHELLANPDVDAGINSALHELVEYFSGMRAYIFEFDYEKSVAKNTYEVCSSGTLPEMGNLQEVPFDIMTFWFDAFEKDGYYAITDIGALDDSRKTEREVLAAQGMTSLFVVPLTRDGKIIGMLGVDEPKRQLTQVERVMALGDYIAVMLTRRDLNRRIWLDNEALASMMGDMPGGFVRAMMDENGSLRPVYFNDGFKKLTGMNTKELVAMYDGDPMTGVHPDDVKTVRRMLDEMNENGEAHSDRYRLVHKNGSYIWLTAFCRVTKAEDGQSYVNIYYADVTEQVQKEERQKELLDNLPYGAALYEYDGKTLCVVHLNKRYWELVNRKPVHYNEEAFLDAAHPDDKALIARELHAAIDEKRDVVCDVRVRYGESEYRPFHIVAKILADGDDKYVFYAVYTPISDETMSIQEMLPIALDAVMNSSADYTYVKDKNFRYICCSKQILALSGLSSMEQVTGKTDYELLDKELADLFRKEDERIFATGEPITGSVNRIPSKDDVVRYARTSKYPLKDAHGNIVGVYGVGHDITEDRAVKSQLDLLANNIPGGIVTFAVSGKSMKIVYCNDGFCELFGGTRSGFLRRGDVKPLDWVRKEDLVKLVKQIEGLVRYGTPIDCTFRVHVIGGGYKWISAKAVATERSKRKVLFNAVLFDVTKHQEAAERIRVSEEENNLALQLGGTTVCRYFIDAKKLVFSPDIVKKRKLPEEICNMPDEPVVTGMIAPESLEGYREFCEAVLRGDKEVSATFRHKYFGQWRFAEAKSSTICSDAGKPIKAVISFVDVTEKLEREMIYKKWQQSLEDKERKAYTLIRFNLSKGTVSAAAEGELLRFDFGDVGESFCSCEREYIMTRVFEADRENYAAFANADTRLSEYYRGNRTDTLEYREYTEDGGVRWLRVKADLVEYTGSLDVEAYLMYEDIDEQKRTELQQKALSETDPLTGMLNRAAFVSRVEEIIKNSKKGEKNAVLMLDVDGFKLVNDVFGHGVGDKALVEIANSLRKVLRSEDLIARLGGDEFMVLLRDIQSENTAAKKAQQICAVTQKAFSAEVRISCSVGIAVAPSDGTSFDMLYKKADCALYYVKGSGKDNFVFYSDNMATEHLVPEKDRVRGKSVSNKKRRMLIVDDNAATHTLMQNIFKDSFIIEKAKDGNTALIRLRHYGAAISVVLLDIMMPGMSGFSVLEKMQQSADLRSIPVIIVSGDGSRETCLRAIRKGATDFITKPVDAEVLRLRVDFAVSKAENERLRAKNSLLEAQNEERERYETAFDSLGIVVIEYDWLNGIFNYMTPVAKYLYGNYDSRMLWQVLLVDMMADTATVQDMQGLVHRIADDREQTSGTVIAKLKTSEGEWHDFRMNVQKLSDEFALTNKLIITLSDLESGTYNTYKKKKTLDGGEK